MSLVHLVISNLLSGFFWKGADATARSEDCAVLQGYLDVKELHTTADPNGEELVGFGSVSALDYCLLSNAGKKDACALNVSSLKKASNDVRRKVSKHKHLSLDLLKVAFRSGLAKVQLFWRSCSAGCHSARYCCRECQRSDWEAHRGRGMSKK
jgi:hypothetical protein